MTRMKNVLTNVRTQVRRVINAQSAVPGQQNSVEDANDEENVTQLSSDFVEDINKQWVYRL